MYRIFIIFFTLLPATAQEKPYVDPVLTLKEKSHWAFVPIVKHKSPSDGNPVDAFLKQKLTEKKLQYSPPADKLVLIRRLTFDLHGLPPTPAEIDAFVNDKSANAYEKLVDRLLASPHYAERQAQHWLDVVRFAETNGYEIDKDRPHAWRYRDYVIRSFHNDKPYDEFLTEQIAGDLLAKGKSPRESSELLIATGMHRCGPVHLVSGNVNPDETRQEIMTEVVNGLSSTVMGVTLSCARCHDHKFDPLSQGDYYRLQAFFAAANYADVEFATPEEKEAYQKRTSEINTRTAPLKKKIAEMEVPYRAKVLEQKKAKLPEATRTALNTPSANRTDEQKKLALAATPLLKVVWDEILEAMPTGEREARQKLKDEQHEIEKGLPAPLPTAWAMTQSKFTEVFVLNRGDVNRKRSVVAPGTLRVLGKTPEMKSRIELAQWITDPKHPLTARVMVNRLWQQHFGRGIVATPNDFGTRGDAPTHPELLDWLAMEFSSNKWSLKHIHKRIVTSDAYKQRSDAPNAEAMKLDPDNKLLWRMNRQRLDAESIRDAMFVASGSINRETYGVSVRVPLEQEVYDLIFTEGEPTGLWPVTADVKQHTRRSIYLYAKRNVRQPMLEAFDQPDTLGSCAIRGKSTFAPQALILMNGPIANDQAKFMAVELIQKHGMKDINVLINEAHRQAIGRLPREEELKVLVEFWEKQSTVLAKPIAPLPNLPKGVDPGQARAFADVCLALFNLNEFIHIP